MGDVLLTGGAVRAAAHGASYLTILVSPAGADAARMLPGVDDVVEFTAPWVDPWTRLRCGPCSSAYVGGRFDLALVLTSFHQSPLPLALLLRLAGVGWVGGISEDYPGSLLDLRHRPPDDLPEAERSLCLVEAAGFRAAPRWPSAGHSLPSSD